MDYVLTDTIYNTESKIYIWCTVSSDVLTKYKCMKKKIVFHYWQWSTNLGSLQKAVHPICAEIMDRIRKCSITSLWHTVTDCKLRTRAHSWPWFFSIKKKKCGGRVAWRAWRPSLIGKGHRFYSSRQPACIHQKPFILSECPSARHWTDSCSPAATPTDSYIS